MTPPKLPTLLLWSAILTLVGLALMVWSVLQPTPLPTILAMSLGQLIGTIAFGMFLLAIVLDLRRDARERKRVREANDPIDPIDPPAAPPVSSPPASPPPEIGAT